MKFQHFLLIVPRSGGPTEVQELGEDAHEAMRVFEERELAANGETVVMIGSPSLEALKRTHSSYFGVHEEVVRALNGAA